MIRKTRLEKIQLEKERVKDELTALGKEEIKKALLEASKDTLFNYP